MTTTTASTYAPPRRRINVRLILFLTAVAVVFGGIGYVILEPILSGGVVHHGDYAEVDLKALGNFMFDEQAGTINDVPAKFRELDNKRVVLEGFMYFDKSAGPSGEFQFVYNVQKCCFGGPPKVQERVFARVPVGRKTMVYDSSVFVQLTGTLHVRVQRNEVGSAVSVYDLDVEKAEPKT